MTEVTPPVLAIVGPTASGKSDLALRAALARAAAGRPTEIVAVDAFTVYRGMDVATATPTAADRAAVPHHLVDVLDPWEQLTVARFQQLARRAIDAIHARAATPLLVGGSGLYWRAVVDELRFPPTDPQVRAALEARWRDDPHGAHALLRRRDPDAADRIDPSNLRRTVRALEVGELTGERFSAYDDAWAHYTSRYPGLVPTYLEPDTDRLRRRIERRAAAMVEAGLLAEAAVLRELPRPLSTTAARAIGYAEALAVLDGDLDPDALAGAIATRTWRYAKRQRAWFRVDPRLTPVDEAAALARLVAA